MKLDTTDTVTISVVSDFDVTIITPGCAPRILNKVICLPVFSTVSNSQSSMIGCERPASRIYNSTVVQLEGQIGLDCNRCWASLNGSHQTRAGPWGNINVAFVIGYTFGFISFAFSRLRSVSIVSLSFSFVCLIPFESTLYRSSIASPATNIVAIDELLLRERFKDSGLYEVSAFKSTGCSEGPI